jgi:ABC-type multidrug transport system ATPase subunit
MVRFAVLRAVWLKNFTLFSRQRVTLLCTCVLSMLLLVGVAVIRSQSPTPKVRPVGSLQLLADDYSPDPSAINRFNVLAVDADVADLFGITGANGSSPIVGDTNVIYHFYFGLDSYNRDNDCAFKSLNVSACGLGSPEAVRKTNDAIARLAPVLQFSTDFVGYNASVPLTVSVDRAKTPSFWSDVNLVTSYCNSRCRCDQCVRARLPDAQIGLKDDTLTLTYPYARSAFAPCDGDIVKQSEVIHVLTAIASKQSQSNFTVQPPFVAPSCAYFEPNFDVSVVLEAALMVFGISVLLPLFVSRPATDNESGTFTTIRIAGVSTFDYLLANFLSDIFVYMLVLAAWLAVGAGVQLAILSHMTAPAVVIICLNGIYLILMANCISFLSPSRVVSITVSYILALVIPTGALVLIFFGSNSVTAPGPVNLFPAMALARSLMDVAKAVGASSTIMPSQLESTGWTLVGFHLAGMAIIAVLLFVFAVGPVQAVRRLLSSARKPAPAGKETDEGSPLLAVQDAVLVANGLSKSYGSRQAVNDVSFTIGKSEVYGLLGVNGAGKTSVIKMLSGELFPSKGSAFIGGTNVHGAGNTRPLIGVLPQHDILFADLTVMEHVLFFLRIKAVPRALERAKADELMGKTGIAAQRSLMGTTLSGGQKRRLSLAIALAGDPVVLFCDEPSSSLDVAATRVLWRVLAEVKREQSVLLTSHNLLECDVLCDRIGILNNGRLIAEAAPTDLKNRLSKHVVVTIQASPNGLAAAIAFMRTVLPADAALVSTNGITNTIVFHAPTSAGVKLSKLFSKLERAGSVHSVVNWSIDEPTLESAFLELIAADDRDNNFVAVEE